MHVVRLVQYLRIQQYSYMCLLYYSHNYKNREVILCLIKVYVLNTNTACAYYSTNITTPTDQHDQRRLDVHT